MEIEEMKGKLQVMKHLGKDDAAAQEKIKEMKNTLEEKIDDLRDMESTNQVLITKERQSNDELQTARKHLLMYSQSSVGLGMNYICVDQELK